MIYIFYFLQMVTIISKLPIFSLSLTCKCANFNLTHEYFCHCLSPFSGFSSKSKPHSKDLFLVLRFYIWTVTFLKGITREHWYSSFWVIYFFFCIYKNCKNNKEYIFHSVPLNKTFTFSSPFNSITILPI